MIILDVLKSRLNNGRRGNIFFYRDTHGNEVDLIIKEGRRLIPVEIKSSATFNEEFVRGIARFRLATGDKSSPGIVFYNGEKRFAFRESKVVNPLLHPGGTTAF